MGFYKRLLEEAEARGWMSPGNKHVCSSCIEEPALSALVAAEATELKCDYCGREDTRKPIAADIDILVGRIAEGLYSEYGNPLEELPWDSEEQRYWGTVLDTSDLLYEVDCSFANDELLDDVVRAFEDRQWCARNYFALRRDQALLLGWENFREQILHRSRYFFLTTVHVEARDLEPGEIDPADMLDQIGAIVTDVGLVVRRPPNTAFFRTRAHGRNDVPSGALELGSPPPDKAQSNRMSPAGISMFSGAADKATAIGEVLSIPQNRDQPLVTTGLFRTAREFTLLDLTNLPAVPSLFEESSNDRPSIMFLRAFVTDLSRPVQRDGHEHVDYVPTQVVAEYFRRVYGSDAGLSLQGILYPSAQVRGGVNCVLFFEPEAFCDLTPGWEADAEKWLALESADTEPTHATADTK